MRRLELVGEDDAGVADVPRVAVEQRGFEGAAAAAWDATRVLAGGARTGGGWEDEFLGKGRCGMEGCDAVWSGGFVEEGARGGGVFCCSLGFWEGVCISVGLTCSNDKTHEGC